MMRGQAEAYVTQILGYTPPGFADAWNAVLDGESMPRFFRPALGDQLIDRLTVQHTDWMRHPHQFDRLRQALRARPVAHLWSAGCAGGLEPLSILEVAEECGTEVHIVASDVSPTALDTAQRKISERPGAAARIRLTRHSIYEPGPPGGEKFDFVFCRNVVMYREAYAVDAIRHLSRSVAVGGALVVAPVEGLLGAPPGFSGSETLGWFERVGETHLRPTVRPRTVPVLELSRQTPLLSSLIRSGDLPAAEAEAEHYVDGHSDDPYGWFTLGEILRQRSESAQAARCYQTVLRLLDAEPKRVRLEMLAQAAAARLDELA